MLGLYQEGLGAEDSMSTSEGVCGCSPIKKERPRPQQEQFGAVRRGLDLGARLALTHPQEVIIHQKKPLEATCVVQDHSGWAKPSFNLS